MDFRRLHTSIFVPEFYGLILMMIFLCKDHGAQVELRCNSTLPLISLIFSRQKSSNCELVLYQNIQKTLQRLHDFHHFEIISIPELLYSIDYHPLSCV